MLLLLSQGKFLFWHQCNFLFLFHYLTRYEFEDTENNAYQHEKEVQNMRRMATIVFGGIFQKQQCWELNMCNIGRAFRENNESAMEFALM